MFVAVRIIQETFPHSLHSQSDESRSIGTKRMMNQAVAWSKRDFQVRFDLTGSIARLVAENGSQSVLVSLDLFADLGGGGLYGSMMRRGRGWKKWM